MKKNRVFFSEILVFLRFILLHEVHRCGFVRFCAVFVLFFTIFRSKTGFWMNLM